MEKPKKRRVLILGITMNGAGTEQAFLRLAERINYNRWDVTLLLARREGAWLSRVPKEIRVETIGDPGAALFLLNRKNACRCAWEGCLRPRPWAIFPLLPQLFRLAAARRDPTRYAAAASRLWITMMRRMRQLPGTWDLAVAFWGDRTMFYLCDKVQAASKVAWLHFDYEHPPREDALYRAYFARCSAVVTVAPILRAQLAARMPDLRRRFHCMENPLDADTLRRLAAAGESLPPAPAGALRLLTVGRLCPQKGTDRLPAVLEKLVREGEDLYWFLVGEGDPDYTAAVAADAAARGVADRLIFLGFHENPYRMMAECDLYVQPSRYEGKPIAVDEALALGCTVVTAGYTSATDSENP